MRCLDIPKIYKRYLRDWGEWCTPILDGKWYNKDYHKETMKKLNQANGGMHIIFMFIDKDAAKL